MSEEHAIPALLGVFRNFPELDDRVCRDCNTEIGRAEDVLAHCSPVAFLRAMHGVRGRKTKKGRPKVNPFERGSHGLPPIDVVGLHPAHDVEVLLDPTGAHELRQIVVLFESGRSVPIRIPESMREPGQLRAAISQLDGGPIRELLLFAADDEERRWLSHLTGGQDLNWGRPDRVVIDGVGADVYLPLEFFRALAKIGFHYFLTVQSIWQGHETRFAEIRAFVREGKYISRLVSSLGTGELLGPLANQPAHAVTVEWGEGGIKAVVHLFLGRQSNFPAFLIQVGSPSLVDPRRGGSGHVFVYDSPIPTAKIVGEATPFRGRMMLSGGRMAWKTQATPLRSLPPRPP